MLMNNEIIYLIGILIAFLVRLAIKEHKESNWLDKAQEKQQTRFEYMNQAILEEPDENKVWDSEKSRWIDMAEVKRKERYKEYRKGKPPTFEEWKAMKEQQKNNEHPGK